MAIGILDSSDVFTTCATSSCWRIYIVVQFHNPENQRETAQPTLLRIMSSQSVRFGTVSYSHHASSGYRSYESDSDDGSVYTSDSDPSGREDEGYPTEDHDFAIIPPGPETSTWPNRLLDVRTMTSYPRTGKAIYNGITEPAFNIISYTWGRYEDRDGTSSGKSLSVTIKDGSWKLPIINSSRKDNGRGGSVYPFSMEELEGVLRIVAEGVDFVWLDVACIDQSSALEKAKEVGKQASIFKRATKAFIWLWEHDEESLRQCVEDFSYIVEKLADCHHRPPTKLADIANNAINDFLDDSFFSSLWTLQESFIRRDAILISRSGRTAMATSAPSNQWPDTHVNFRDMAYLPALWVSEYANSCDDQVREAVKRSGFKEIFAENPLALFNMAILRGCQIGEDRVYGLQQIYGLKLGKSISASDARDPSLEDLTNEFATALNKKYPILAQAFVHVTGVAHHDRWRIDQSVVIPAWLYSVVEVRPPQVPGMTVFNSKEFGTNEVIFEGSTLPLRKLVDSWKTARSFTEEERTGRPPSCGDDGEDAEPGRPDLGNEVHDLNDLQHSIYVDEGPWLEDLPSVNERSELGLGYDRPLQIGRDLAHLTEEGYNWQILILGKLLRQSEISTSNVVAWAGVLVFQIGEETWRRAGFCTWLEEDLSQSMASILNRPYSEYQLM
ncbi:uncharacterized protein PAC_00304 [Phialocephala subalpina]|uniref:Heterokaryon incompatibility domain-containing protein n=1 Tax=Phialocephala subalpina TaxID=576137 RepID=A0A1L7WCD0_9HELO|nr:uncharacterized protein PAC_00304 [Phialocephala subalpina]